MPNKRDDTRNEFVDVLPITVDIFIHDSFLTKFRGYELQSVRAGVKNNLEPRTVSIEHL